MSRAGWRCSRTRGRGSAPPTLPWPCAPTPAARRLPPRPPSAGRPGRGAVGPGGGPGAFGKRVVVVGKNHLGAPGGPVGPPFFVVRDHLPGWARLEDPPNPPDRRPARLGGPRRAHGPPPVGDL